MRDQDPVISLPPSVMLATLKSLPSLTSLNHRVTVSPPAHSVFTANYREILDSIILGQPPGITVLSYAVLLLTSSWHRTNFPKGYFFSLTSIAEASRTTGEWELKFKGLQDACGRDKTHALCCGPPTDCLWPVLFAQHLEADDAHGFLRLAVHVDYVAAIIMEEYIDRINKITTKHFKKSYDGYDTNPSWLEYYRFLTGAWLHQFNRLIYALQPERDANYHLSLICDATPFTIPRLVGLCPKPNLKWEEPVTPVPQQISFQRLEACVGIVCKELGVSMDVYEDNISKHRMTLSQENFSRKDRQAPLTVPVLKGRQQDVVSKTRKGTTIEDINALAFPPLLRFYSRGPENHILEKELLAFGAAFWDSKRLVKLRVVPLKWIESLALQPAYKEFLKVSNERDLQCEKASDAWDQIRTGVRNHLPEESISNMPTSGDLDPN